MRSGVDEIQNGLELTQTWRAGMPFCKRLDISHFEPGRPGQGVETRDCRIYFSAPADVEDCACRSGLGKTIQDVHFIVEQHVAAGLHTPWRTGIRVHQFDWHVLADPLGSVQSGRSQAADDPLAM